jgi:hypothetical protein
MSPQNLGLIIGGLLPALCYGLTGVFAKPATAAGIGVGWYVAIVGAAILLTGMAIQLLQGGAAPTLRAGVFATLAGVTWAIGTAGVAIALLRYDALLSHIVPLYNLNTLVAVVIGLTVFAEWRDVNVLKLLAGTVLITAGGALVAGA